MATHPTAPTAAAAPRYSLPPVRLPAEDILFCVSVDLEASAEMKSAATASASAPSSGSASTTSPPPPPAAGAGAARPAVRRMDAVKQALHLFAHSKLTMCPDHRCMSSISNL